MQSITVIGRRWFQKSYGNTYHTAEMLIDGTPAGKTCQHYGYGEQYLYTALDQLTAEGKIPPREEGEPPWRWAQRLGITLHHSAVDVGREKDL